MKDRLRFLGCWWPLLNCSVTPLSVGVLCNNRGEAVGICTDCCGEVQVWGWNSESESVQYVPWGDAGNKLLEKSLGYWCHLDHMESVPGEECIIKLLDDGECSKVPLWTEVIEGAIYSAIDREKQKIVHKIRWCCNGQSCSDDYCIQISVRVISVIKRVQFHHATACISWVLALGLWFQFCDDFLARFGTWLGSL